MTRTAPAQWAFHHIIEIDRYTPFCGAFFRASNERRQVIAAYPASSACGCSPDPLHLTVQGRFQVSVATVHRLPPSW